MSEQSNQGQTQDGSGGHGSGSQGHSGEQTTTQNVVSFDWMKKGTDGKDIEKR